jgi:hypothetical protein
MSNSFNERAKIEIQIGTYVEIALIVTEEETLTFIKSRIAQLEQKLREIDEWCVTPLAIQKAQNRGCSEQLVGVKPNNRDTRRTPTARSDSTQRAQDQGRYPWPDDWRRNGSTCHFLAKGNTDIALARLRVLADLLARKGTPSPYLSSFIAEWRGQTPAEHDTLANTKGSQ